MKETFMKKKKGIRMVMLFAAGAWMTVAGVSSCSMAPKVIAEVKEVLPVRQVDSVMVYNVNEHMPEAARAIGTVKVTDGGMTPTHTCLYSNMLALAVRKTADCGGNALHIDQHKEPGFWTSTCHRIWCTMYIVPDSLVDGTTMTALQRLEEKNDMELAQMAKKQISIRERMMDNPPDILKLSAGPAWITSEIQTPQATYKSKGGFALQAEYQHLWRIGLGVGLSYKYFSTSFDEGFDLRMHYVGPNIVYSLKLGSKWRTEVSLGIGYSSYMEKVKNGGVGLYGNPVSTESGLGVTAHIGAEYMVSKKIGIGMQFGAFSMRLKRPSGYDTDAYEFYGIRRADLGMGIRYYL